MCRHCRQQNVRRNSTRPCIRGLLARPPCRAARPRQPEPGGPTVGRQGAGRRDDSDGHRLALFEAPRRIARASRHQGRRHGGHRRGVGFRGSAGGHTFIDLRALAMQGLLPAEDLAILAQARSLLAWHAKTPLLRQLRQGDRNDRTRLPARLRRLPGAAFSANRSGGDRGGDAARPLPPRSRARLSSRSLFRARRFHRARRDDRRGSAPGGRSKRPAWRSAACATIRASPGRFRRA